MSKKLKNTDLKNTGLPGRSYFENAAKQIEWPVHIDDKTIDVPEDELERAGSHLMVCHLRSFGFHIQSVIVCEKTNVFDPVTSKKLPFIKQEPETGAFKLNQKFRVVSTFEELEICRIERTKVELFYRNRGKHNILLSPEQLERNLSFRTWERL